jgi:hypothetical protein
MKKIVLFAVAIFYVTGFTACDDGYNADDSYVKFDYEGKSVTFKHKNESNYAYCEFTSSSSFTISCGNKSNDEYFTMYFDNDNQFIFGKGSYGIYSKKPTGGFAVNVTYTSEGVTRSKYLNISEEMYIGEVTFEKRGYSYEGTFNCKMQSGEITNGVFSIKLKQHLDL